ncbi:MAG: hypothetical protein EBU08_10680 [Micrococcales bacterium]|nr:hypothetical protein [Micrococcales bacterium]
MPTLKARDSQPEGYEAGLRRSQPQLGTIVRGVVEGDERIQVFGTPTTATSGRSPEFRKGSNPNPVEFVEDLLRTPSVTDGTGGAISETQARERGRMVKVADQVAELAFENDLKVSDSIAASLLPTPAVAHVRNHDEPVENYLERRAKFESGEYRGMPGVSLGVSVRMNLLMTPVATEGLKAPAQQTSEVKGKNGQVWLSNQAKDMEISWGKFEPALSNQAKDMEISWGKFEPAIRRWEELTRPAPAPTKPDGKDGNHRLSAEFTEWMMGLPEGWVTSPEIGLKRNDQLKACGNGVVPQQAEMALRILLQGLQVETVIRGGLDDVLPTPTVMDQRDGKHFRTVAIKNLANGKNRGLNLNNVVEAIGVDWQDGDTFVMTEEGLKKNDK